LPVPFIGCGGCSGYGLGRPTGLISLADCKCITTTFIIANTSDIDKTTNMVKIMVLSFYD
jgi:hypothetical protein